ncbi:MAG TPA: glycosyltransferase [Patescibacteria group bacterium]|nr:glycosyltransferase [Patescibacteria group bacterium]
MKIALVHDYIKEYGGAERVLEALHELYPDAPVYTSVYLPSYLGPHKERFRNWNIKTSWAQWLPFKAKLISPLRLISPLLFRQFDFSGFDVVIVSATGAYFPNSIRRNKKKEIRNKQNDSPLATANKPVHICYCHTPPRYLYGYATAREWKKNVVFRIVGAIANHFLRMVDFTASQNVDQYIANSEEVKKRIQKFYRREAVVIYPPVNISAKFEVRSSKFKNNNSYFLAGGRLARPKHIDLIVEACIRLKLPLKVFGKGFAGYEDELRSSANGKWQIANGEKNPLVEFVGEVSDEEKLELMAGAKAFLFASEDEDFGIVPVEAMSVGTPVIAYKSGGVKETVIDPSAGSGQVTGIFFEELTVESLVDAIKRFEKLKISTEECRKQAEKFSKERFLKEIADFIKRKGYPH